PIEVYGPGARDRNGEPIPKAGKRPVGKDWAERARKDPPHATEARVRSDALSTGILGDEAPGIDIDVRDPTLVDALAYKAEQIFGTTPLKRVGQPPKLLLVYRAAQPFAKIQTPTFILPNGTEGKVEALCLGQQWLADGTHPDTNEPYRWLDASPSTVPLAELS